MPWFQPSENGIELFKDGLKNFGDHIFDVYATEFWATINRSQSKFNTKEICLSFTKIFRRLMFILKFEKQWLKYEKTLNQVLLCINRKLGQTAAFVNEKVC